MNDTDTAHPSSPAAGPSPLAPGAPPAPSGTPSAPALSVAMSVHNGERFLAEAIDSVLRQSFGDFEFLIVDDGSTDQTPQLLGAYAARDPRIQLTIRENRGLIASLNQLLELARAPIVARMDADDICHPERFARQMAFLAAHPDHGVVGSWTTDIDERGQSWPLSGEEHPLTNDAFQHNIRHGGPLLAHPAVMYRREVVRSVGGYHAAFRHCEDLDLWLRLASTTRIANIPERLILYRHYAGQVSRRHALQQQIGASIAYEAWRTRAAGRPDPTENLAQLPPLEEVDGLFGDSGAAHRVRAQVAQGILHSRTGLKGEGFSIILQHLRDGGDRAGLWRTVLRLLRFGEPFRASRLAGTLLSQAWGKPATNRANHP